MNQYETIIIIDPNVEAEGVEKITEEVQNLITGSGGIVTEVDKWGKKRLAYEVAGHNDGIYILINFEAEPEFAQRLARYCGLTEQIIKYMTVRAENMPEPVGAIRSGTDDDDDDDDDRPYRQRDDADEYDDEDE